MIAKSSADVTDITRIASVPTILDVLCRTTGMGFAAVAQVSADKWVACSVRDDIGFGLQAGDELRIETTICSDVRATREAVVMNDVAEDHSYSGHLAVTTYGFRSYISMPIVLADGRFFGTLCAIDPRPVKLNTPEVLGMFKLFAELIAFHLDAISTLDTSVENLKDEHENSELREQFIAVLGHDLRNPLASIAAGVRLITKTPLDERARGLLPMIQASIGRMAGLIDNITDFARGRLGGGLTLKANAAEPLEPVLQHVVAELRAGSPDREIMTDFAVTEPVFCDTSRIAQMLSNLVGNAITHGPQSIPIRVRAATVNGMFEASVANDGLPISAAVMARMFQPFFRGEVKRTEQGLGLGLYIASEIAHAHGGTLTVSSSHHETRFTFRMPVKPAGGPAH